MNELLNWDDILDDIEDQKAVLLLGHGFLSGAHEALNQLFKEKLGEKLLHFYSKDGLFLFSDNVIKTVEARKEAARFYKTIRPNEPLLKKIVELPFRLIISANPDKALVNVFAKYHHQLQFDYYSSKNKEKDYPLERPTIEKPLLYNLCGSFEDHESLLLDYDDLFSLFATLLPDNKIPDYAVRLPLKKATTYIFIGFQFERWYTQLLLRYLNMNDRFNNNSSNYALQTSFADTEIQQFFLKQFNVKYIGTDLSFFEELHQRFSKKYPEKLRKLVDELSPSGTTVIQLLEKSEFESAFTMLKIFGTQFNDEEKETLTLTESNYSEFLKEKLEPTTSQENLTILLNKIRINLRELAKKLK